MSMALDSLEFPLWGSRLIEASAGTGKTWTIAALYLRLVLGHGGPNGFTQPLRPADILVMTFTRAATRELSDRIRSRLLEAARCFRGETLVPEGDDFLADLLAAYPDGPARSSAAWRLASAAEGMDDAAIHTIDAWCQRMLREHAFDSGCPFDEELDADESALQTAAVQDYWRQNCYRLPSDLLDAVLQVWPSVNALLQDMRSLSAQELPTEAGAGSLAENLQRQLDQRHEAIAHLKSGWVERAQALQDWLDNQTAPKVCPWDRRKLAPGNYTKWLAGLSAWAQSPDSDALDWTDAARHRLSPAGVLEARKADAPSITLPQDFQALADLWAALDALPSVAVALRLHAGAQVQTRMAQLKRQVASFGFADMLQRLNQALAGANGVRLRERIITQYPVALVDEFQDTSPQQYQLFAQLYHPANNDPHTALLLIGDPKQSIYGFRGADIYSYLAARQATAGRHYVLGTNYRSTQAVVEAVNHLFAQAEQRPGAGAFLFRHATTPNNPLPFVAVQAQGRAEQFQDTHGSVPALALHHDLELRNAHEHRRLFAVLCAERIVGWLNDAQAGFVTLGQPLQRLRPADIAVLVRNRIEAEAVRRELRRRGVASVYLSDKNSVFDSDEAGDLLHWLQAVAAPLDVRRLRAGLATGTIGLSLHALAQLASDEEALDQRTEQLRGLHHVWQTQGVLTMLHQTLHELDLPARWLAQTGGERRLTNFLHLAELLQDASAELKGEQALIRWLAEQLDSQRSGSEEQIVRLESDADLVKVVTIHKSKGLEYPVVCLPFANSFKAVERKGTSFVPLTDEATGQRHLHLDLTDAVLAQADHERLREDMRLLYVALTRARHALWLGFAASKDPHSSQKCMAHRSALGVLLGGDQAREAADWAGPLQALAQGQTALALHAVVCHDVRALPCTRLHAHSNPAPLLPAQTYRADFDRRWNVGSFSQLVRGASAVASLGAVLPLPRPADDERLEVVAPTPRLPAPASTTDEVAVWHQFTRGPVVGNFLHDQLEWLAREQFALATQPTLAERLRQRCERAGYTDEADAVVQWLSAAVQTVLPGVGVALDALEHTLPEMEFWLPTQQLPAVQVDALCQHYLWPGQERALLPERTLHGMLMGFADLVFEQDGRYWVLDYKSNYLGPDASAYHAEALQRAMLTHRYDVQAALYLLALHRLLRQRLGSQYEPAQHLGGALYLFLRGIDGPQAGVVTVAADPALVAAFDALLGDAGPSL
ncbi:exodeoxyribonuclease V subunit beta [Giesbergeria anulus]|uniref:RecBCD enzyme subunit RecB n=1 Tax=Giesbergeria anulus TaxID=180197 RepID=A0A1H9MY57_9BURK|nr:exodeoxyribonuclease V subunit beta [Giesbergeria anulus]SER28650.1 DNA helicase/exodeoxyribonuclease V, beta subunit [Giesbergeria anulus]